MVWEDDGPVPAAIASDADLRIHLSSYGLSEQRAAEIIESLKHGNREIKFPVNT